MRSLFRFLWRYYPFFLFVLLEFVALRMVLAGGYQSTVSSTLYHVVGGVLHERVDKIRSYFYLEHDNELLLADNNRLKKQIQDLNIQMQGNTSFMPLDSLFSKPDLSVDVDSVVNSDSLLVNENSLLVNADSLTTNQDYASFEFIPALVIHNQTLHARNYLMLNKGSAEGIKKNMGVINAQGVVGIVSDVSEHFATVLSVLNVNANFSALVQPYGELCSLHWDGESAEYAQLLHVERSAELAVGDTVISSGFSYVFPKGMMMGYVSKIQESPNDFQVQLKLSVDFSRVHQVHVIRNPYYDELQQLRERSIEQ